MWSDGKPFVGMGAFNGAINHVLNASIECVKRLFGQLEVMPVHVGTHAGPYDKFWTFFTVAHFVTGP